MRITVTVDEELIARAAEITGCSDISELVTLGLQALVQQESAKHRELLVHSDRRT